MRRAAPLGPGVAMTEADDWDLAITELAAVTTMLEAKHEKLESDARSTLLGVDARLNALEVRVARLTAENGLLRQAVDDLLGRLPSSA